MKSSQEVSLLLRGMQLKATFDKPYCWIFTLNCSILPVLLGDFALLDAYRGSETLKPSLLARLSGLGRRVAWETIPINDMRSPGWCIAQMGCWKEQQNPLPSPPFQQRRKRSVWGVLVTEVRHSWCHMPSWNQSISKWLKVNGRFGLTVWNLIIVS